MSNETPPRGGMAPGAWLAIGVGMGTAIGIAFNNLTAGILIGMAVGGALAFATSRR